MGIGFSGGGGGAPTASPTFTGTVTLPQVSYGVYNIGNSSTAATANWNNGMIQKVTMTGNCTFTLSNPVTGTTYVLKCIQDATGSRTYTWPATVIWPGGSAPTGSGASKVDVITLFWDGTNYFGGYNLNYTP